ncbi:MAG: hypothetical protein OEY03_06255, partial [Rhizobacter sp.]|nr:hypothetical protein [Rhizobacter sp.]
CDRAPPPVAGFDRQRGVRLRSDTGRKGRAGIGRDGQLGEQHRANQAPAHGANEATRHGHFRRAANQAVSSPRLHAAGELPAPTRSAPTGAFTVSRRFGMAFLQWVG